MDRRTFVQHLLAAPLAPAGSDVPAPRVRVVSRYRPAALPGMPGPYPGRVVRVRSAACLDPASRATNAAAVREMMARGLSSLTGERTVLEAWRKFFTKDDVVGIKVNCGGHPHVVSDHEIVAEAVRQLLAVGLRPEQIHVYERFQNQLNEVELRAAPARGGGHRRRGGREPSHGQSRDTTPTPTWRPTSSVRRIRAPT